MGDRYGRDRGEDDHLELTSEPFVDFATPMTRPDKEWEKYTYPQEGGPYGAPVDPVMIGYNAFALEGEDDPYGGYYENISANMTDLEEDKTEGEGILGRAKQNLQDRWLQTGTGYGMPRPGNARRKVARNVDRAEDLAERRYSLLQWKKKVNPSMSNTYERRQERISPMALSMSTAVPGNAVPSARVGLLQKKQALLRSLGMNRIAGLLDNKVGLLRQRGKRRAGAMEILNKPRLASEIRGALSGALSGDMAQALGTAYVMNQIS